MATNNALNAPLPLTGANGGTGINNGSSTITIGGNVTFSGSFSTTINVTAGTNITFPTTGTLATTSQIPALPLTPSNGGTGVSNNNSNTITLGGTFTTSGSNPLTFTTTGSTNVTVPTSGTLATTANIPAFPLSLVNGGTNAALTASTGGILYSGASAFAVLAGTATANQLLLSGSGAAPSWSTATYPASTTINQILYSSANNIVSGLTTANSSTLITSGGGVPSFSQTLPSTVQANITQTGTITSGTWNGTLIAPQFGGTGVSSPTQYTLPIANGASAFSFAALTNGQMLIGSTGASPVAATLTGGAGVVITNSAGGVTVTGAANPNIIIGGNFDTNPWQRGTSFSTVSSSTYTADRFQWLQIGTGVVSIFKATDAPTVGQAGIYSINCLHVDVTTADASITSGKLYMKVYAVEGYDFAQIAQRTFTISFWHKHTKTGTYCVSFRNSGLDRSYVAEYSQSVTDTWELATITITASPSAGTWNYTNGVGTYITFAMAAGSTFQTTANAWQTGNFFATSNQVNAMDNTANNFKIQLVKIEPGSVATPYPLEIESSVIEKCYRYYQPIVCGSTAVPASAGDLRMPMLFPVLMRTSPSAVVNTVLTYDRFSLAPITQSSTNITLLDNSAYGAQIRMQNFAGLATTDAGSVAISGASGPLGWLSAEL